MRGKGRGQRTAMCSNGITPAHAGKRCRRAAQRAEDKDHPRPCGEKALWYTASVHSRGSPPPMRGKGVERVLSSPAHRITPAHAGKSKEGDNMQEYDEDHPRPCGEKSARALSITARAGSPPPMRGKGSPALMASSSRRITPAHAGKSRPTGASSRSARDHPRPCGEKSTAFSSKCKRVGSPPPMRGKANARTVIERAAGITPAHAGKSREISF